MRFDQHTVVLLTRPSDPPELPQDAIDRLRDAHLAHQAGLVQQGLVLAAGPFLHPDDEQLRGSWCCPSPRTRHARFRQRPRGTGRSAGRRVRVAGSGGHPAVRERPDAQSMLEAASGD